MKKAVLLAGGLGTRLKPFTDSIPKPLLPVGEKAILEIQLEKLSKAGFEEIYVATNYKAEYIEKFLGDGKRYGTKVFVSKEDKPLGTAGPLKLLEDKLGEDPFLVMNGDILTLLDMNKIYQYACDVDSIFTAGIKEIIMPYDFGNITFEGDRITNIVEKPDIITYALAGINVLKPEIFNFIPKNKYFGIDTLMKNMLETGKTITKYIIDDYWIDIGRMDDYEKVQKDYELLERGTE